MVMTSLQEIGRPPEGTHPVKDVICRACTHKTGHATARERIVGVVEQLVEIVERRCRLYPSGPIFRNSQGGSVMPSRRTSDSRRRAGRRSSGRLLSARRAPYSYRHAWATHALEEGRLSDWEVAKALGHVTTQMVHLHYDHSRRNTEHLRDIFKRAHE